MSFLYGLKGPCFSITTACSSALVALDAAAKCLQLGTSDAAFAAGVNFMLHTATWVSLCALHVLSPNTRCKTFDRAADGLGRGESCVAVMLGASPSGYRLPVLQGTSVNQDGRSASFAAPNGRAQEAALRKSLASEMMTGLSPRCWEAHGTGTALGDLIEVAALVNALGPTALSLSSVTSLRQCFEEDGHYVNTGRSHRSRSSCTAFELVVPY